ncbi:MAG: hypothetical protein WBO49_02615 [Candidatus Saccharimonas sp.]
MDNKLQDKCNNQTKITDVKSLEQIWLGIRDDYRTLVGLDNLGVVEVEDDTECAENSDV